MKLLKKINWKVLREYIDNNLILANKHPEHDIWILNYAPKAQAKGFWDEYTLSCRGMVVDADGNILARPFQKFKNFEEHDPSEIDMTQPFEIFEKLDGSLIILFYYEKIMQWMVASRGSFISEQVQKAKKQFKQGVFGKLDKNKTYLFETIYPENRIVVDYHGLDDLFLLAVINTKSGIEVPYEDIVKKCGKFFKVVNKIYDVDINNIFELRDLEEDNKEGFVVRFKNGFRVKVKFDEYVRLHGILTNVSNITVWEHLKNDYDFDRLLDRVPDEFNGWLKVTIAKLRGDFYKIERLAIKEFIRIYHVNGITERSEFAEEAKKSEYQSILFKLYDKRPYDEIIWKMVRPAYSKPFRDGYEYTT